MDDSLRRGGLARELINRIQTMRKELDLDFVDRIHVVVEGPGAARAALDEYGEMIAHDTLADTLEFGRAAEREAVKETEIDGETFRVGLSRV